MKFAATLAASVLTCVSLSACAESSSNDSDDRLVVSVSLFPIAEIVARVGGNAVDVVTLTPPGADAHDVELTAKQIKRLGDSDVVFYFGDDFQPGAQKAIETLDRAKVIDLFDDVELLDAALGHAGESEDHHNDSHGEHDPHVWLDPANMIAMTQRVVDTLTDVSPGNADMFRTNGAEYVSELTQLGDYLDTALGRTGDEPSRCATTTLYTAHQGFTYLAHRAGLELVPIAGVNPDEQVSAQYLEDLADDLEGKNITIFFESLIPSSTAQTLADALKVRTDHLNPLEGLSQTDIDAGVTYVSAQRENIDKIASALGCA
jgi:zinc transport system substrate-binding protein